MSTKQIRTTCTRDCPNTCGLIADVEDGRAVRLYGDPEHPLNGSRVCSKCQRYLDRVYHPRRMLYPLRKVNGDFRRITWNAALDELAERIKTVCANSGASSIFYYQGFGARTALKMLNRRFFNHLGAVSFLTGTVCGGTGQAAQDLDFGERISHDLRDLENSSTIVIWGRNPAVTNINILPAIKSVRKSGGTVILIDPLETKTAALCDVTIQPRPGTDAWLALALARLVFDANAEDKDFLHKHCDNFEEYKKLVYKYDINYLSSCCDVPVASISNIAQILIRQRPVSFLLGWGLHRWEYAHTAIRAIDALGAVCGSIGVSGGGVSQGFEEYLPYDWDTWGDWMNPNSRRLMMPLLGEELAAADPPIELSVVSGGNPLVMLPDSNAVRTAFERIPFKVVIGHFLDDTAQNADLFLPTTTFLEENDVVASYGHSYVTSVKQAIEPLGKAKSDFQIFMELATRFDFADDYVKTSEEWLDIILRPTWEMGKSKTDLDTGGFFLPSVPAVPYVEKVFPTTTGKFQLMDNFEMPAETISPATPLSPGRYRLFSTAPFFWLCSETNPNQFKGLLPVQINTQEALRAGLKHGDKCRLQTSQGTIICQVVCSDTQRSDLVCVPRGGWGLADRNINVLTVAKASKVGNGTAYYETVVSIDGC